ncbi:MAG: LacI family transcriptional regulator [Acidobacteria bacterium]|nr:MAG: LacI family transcriptional regulator [Acidobacteriota bacterium]
MLDNRQREQRGTRKSGATIVDIAQQLGVSAMTVSRALRGSPEVSDLTRKRVLECANELGYRPNRWARSLVTRKTSIIGVVVPDISHSFFAEVTRGLEEVVSRAGYNVLLCDSWLDAEREKAEIEMLVSSTVDGLVIASEQPEKSPQLFRKLRENGVPFVLIDRFFPKAGFPAVLVDDFQVGRLATEHLIQLGHTRIAHIQGPPISPASLRYRAYLETLEANRIPFLKQWARAGRFDIQSGREAMAALLRATPRPTAVFAGNDPMAIGALYACREAGLAVPRDISVVGAGNIEGAHHPNPFLTTVDWPREELGRTAGTLLLSIIRQGSEQKIETVKTFPPQLLIRQSTGAAA